MNVVPIDRVDLLAFHRLTERSRPVERSTPARRAPQMKVEPRRIADLQGTALLILIAVTSSVLFAGVSSFGSSETSVFPGHQTVEPASAVHTNLSSPRVSSPASTAAGADYHVEVITDPSICKISIDGVNYFNGTWDNSTAPGYNAIEALPCVLEAFASWHTTAGSVVSSTLLSTTFDASSNGTLTAQFVAGYNVTFNETGLLVGTLWTVTLNGTPQSQSVNQIQFVEADGTFPYTITRVPLFATHGSGRIDVAGADLLVQVHFTSITYSVTFSEKGLPAETQWSVSVNGTRQFTPSQTEAFAELNSTAPAPTSYSFQIWSVAGYSSNVTEGTLKVTGGSQTIYVLFTQNATSSSGIPAKTWYIVGGAVVIVAVIGSAIVWVQRKASTPPPR
jgi:hypothetical protein